MRRSGSLWLAFSNPNSENYSEITGYLKLSINVTCTGDESVQIEDDDGPEDTDVLMPPSLNPMFFQVKLRFFQAQDIPPMDMGVGFLRKAIKTPFSNKGIYTLSITNLCQGYLGQLGFHPPLSKIFSKINFGLSGPLGFLYNLDGACTRSQQSQKKKLEGSKPFNHQPLPRLSGPTWILSPPIKNLLQSQFWPIWTFGLSIQS